MLRPLALRRRGRQLHIVRLRRVELCRQANDVSVFSALERLLEEQIVRNLVQGCVVVDERGEEEIEVDDAALDGLTGELDIIADLKGPKKQDQHGGRRVANQTPDRDEADRDQPQDR